MTRKPDPLPDQTAVFILPDGRPSPDFFRWLRDADRAVKSTIDFIDTPVAPAEIEMAEDWPVLIPFAANKDYVLIQNNQVERTITATVTDCDSGTCTATFKVNTTALGGTANSVSSTEQSQSHSSSNVLGVGDDLVMTISSNASCVELRANVKTTRTIVAS